MEELEAADRKTTTFLELLRGIRKYQNLKAIENEIRKKRTKLKTESIFLPKILTKHQNLKTFPLKLKSQPKYYLFLKAQNQTPIRIKTQN